MNWIMCQLTAAVSEKQLIDGTGQNRNAGTCYDRQAICILILTLLLHAEHARRREEGAEERENWHT